MFLRTFFVYNPPFLSCRRKTERGKFQTPSPQNRWIREFGGTKLYLVQGPSPTHSENIWTRRFSSPDFPIVTKRLNHAASYIVTLTWINFHNLDSLSKFHVIRLGPNFSSNHFVIQIQSCLSQTHRLLWRYLIVYINSNYYYWKQ